MEFQSRQMKQQLVQEDYGHRRILDFECMKSTLEKELDIADHQIKELIVTIYDVFISVYNILSLTESLGCFTVKCY